jgi:hypothetical protein
MKEGESQPSGDWHYEVMLGAPLSQPGWVRDNVLFVPIALAVMFGLVLFLPSFSREMFLLALALWPPMTIWSVGLFLWAGRHRLTRDAATDRRILLETTNVVLPNQAIGAPVASLLFTLIGVRCLQAAGLLSCSGATLAVVGYLAVLAISYLFLRDPMVRFELARVKLPRSTLLGRLVAPGMPNLVPWAILGLFLSVVLVRLGGALLFAGAGFLLLGPYLIHGSVVNLERWRRFRRFMRAERERWREEAVEG